VVKSVLAVYLRGCAVNYSEVKHYLSKNQFTWLITGVAGFIGSNLMEALLPLNQKVIDQA